MHTHTNTSLHAHSLSLSLTLTQTHALTHSLSFQSLPFYFLMNFLSLHLSAQLSIEKHFAKSFFSFGAISKKKLQAGFRFLLFFLRFIFHVLIRESARHLFFSRSCFFCFTPGDKTFIPVWWPTLQRWCQTRLIVWCHWWAIPTIRQQFQSGTVALLDLSCRAVLGSSPRIRCRCRLDMPFWNTLSGSWSQAIRRELA